MMVKFGRTNHLTHPLCETLLRQKWLSYGFPIYMLNLILYLVFLVTFSYFIVSYSSCNHHDPIDIQTRISLPSPGICPNTNFASFNQSATFSQIFCTRFLIIYCCLNFILEIIQFVQDGREYFSDIENYIQWTLYVSTTIFAFPFLLNQSWHYQWTAGAIGIFTAYFALLFLFGRLHIYGIYVIMFLEIMKTLLRVLSLFSILIIGFALTFCVVRPFQRVRESPLNRLDMILKFLFYRLGFVSS